MGSFMIDESMSNLESFFLGFSVFFVYLDVSKKNGTLKSSILIGFSLINHPFWGTTIFGNTYLLFLLNLSLPNQKTELASSRRIGKHTFCYCIFAARFVFRVTLEI